MGIPGLLKWLQAQHDIGTRHTGKPLSCLVHGDRNTFVVDGNNWAIMIHQATDGFLDAFTGGNWLLFYRRIEAFLQAMARMKARLVFVFDSVRPQPKRNVLKQRRWETSGQVWALQKLCCETVHTDFWYCQRLLDAAARTPLRPAHLVDVAGAILCSLKSRYAIDIYDASPGVDADLGIVAYCERHRANIAGILSFDNDFLLLPHGCPVVGISIPRAPDAPVTIVHALPQDHVARLVGGRQRLGLFAAIAGCDYSKTYFDYMRRDNTGVRQRSRNFERLTATLQLVKDFYAAVGSEAPPDPSDSVAEEADAEAAGGSPTAPLGLEDEEDDVDSVSEDEDEVVAEPGPEVAALVSTVDRQALEALAQNLERPADRQPFVWAGLQACAFFAVNHPACNGWPLLPYPAYVPVQEGYRTLLAAEFGDGLVPNRPALDRLAMALEYCKACRTDPRKPVTLSYTVEAALVPEMNRIIGPASPDELPAEWPERLSVWYSRFGAQRVAFPKDMHALCPEATLRTASAVDILVHLLAPGTAFHQLPGLKDADRLFLLSLHYLLANNLIAAAQIPVVVATYAMTQAEVLIQPGDAFDQLQPTAALRMAEGVRHVYVSHIGLDWTTQQVMDRLRERDVAPRAVLALQPHSSGRWQSCLLQYRSYPEAVRMQEFLDGRRDLGAAQLWCVVPRRLPVPCARGAVLASAVQPVLHMAAQLNRCLLAFPNVPYEPWRTFNGLTFQMLYLQYRETLARWGQLPDIGPRVDRLLEVVRQHFSCPGAVEVRNVYIHECWPYHRQVQLGALSFEATSASDFEDALASDEVTAEAAEPVAAAEAKPKRVKKVIVKKVVVKKVVRAKAAAPPGPAAALLPGREAVLGAVLAVLVALLASYWPHWAWVLDSLVAPA